MRHGHGEHRGCGKSAPQQTIRTALTSRYPVKKGLCSGGAYLDYASSSIYPLLRIDLRTWIGTRDFRFYESEDGKDRASQKKRAVLKKITPAPFARLPAAAN